MLRSVCAVLVLFLGGLVSGVAAPAWACGCGAYIPDRAGASVVDERAMVAWDGKTQDILMSFNVSGSSDKAAWIMPVPFAAKVSLGHTEAFEELGRLTAPRVEYRDSWWPRCNPTGRQRSNCVGYMVGGQGISASGWPGCEPCTVHRGPPGAVAPDVHVRQTYLSDAAVPLGDDAADRRSLCPC